MIPCTQSKNFPEPKINQSFPIPVSIHPFLQRFSRTKIEESPRTKIQKIIKQEDKDIRQSQSIKMIPKNLFQRLLCFAKGKEKSSISPRDQQQQQHEQVTQEREEPHQSPIRKDQSQLKLELKPVLFEVDQSSEKLLASHIQPIKLSRITIKSDNTLQNCIDELSDNLNLRKKQDIDMSIIDQKGAETSVADQKYHDSIKRLELLSSFQPVNGKNQMKLLDFGYKPHKGDFPIKNSLDQNESLDQTLSQQVIQKVLSQTRLLKDSLDVTNDTNQLQESYLQKKQSPQRSYSTLTKRGTEKLGELKVPKRMNVYADILKTPLEEISRMRKDSYSQLKTYDLMNRPTQSSRNTIQLSSNYTSRASLKTSSKAQKQKISEIFNQQKIFRNLDFFGQGIKSFNLFHSQIENNNSRSKSVLKVNASSPYKRKRILPNINKTMDSSQLNESTIHDDNSRYQSEINIQLENTNTESLQLQTDETFQSSNIFSRQQSVRGSDKMPLEDELKQCLMEIQQKDNNFTLSPDEPSILLSLVELTMKHPIFKQLTSESVKVIVQRCCEIMFLKKYQILYKEQDETPMIFIPIYGHINIWNKKNGSLGKVILGWTLGEEAFCDTNFICRLDNAFAEAECAVFCIHKQQWDSLKQEMKDAAYFLNDATLLEEVFKRNHFLKKKWKTGGRTPSSNNREQADNSKSNNSRAINKTFNL